MPFLLASNLVFTCPVFSFSSILLGPSLSLLVLHLHEMALCSSLVLQKTDSQLLAQFYFSDEELNAVSQELDSFDGRQDPERCMLLVNQLRACQDKVLGL